MNTKVFIGFFSFIAAAALCLPCSAFAEPVDVSTGTNGIEYAKGERLAGASGHFARARSLIIAAVREFDRGRALADPQVMINSDRMRNTLIDQAEILERVLDPQPRVTRGGIKYGADNRLLGGAAD